MVLSPFSAVSGFHLDKSGFMTWLCIHEGTKILFIAPPTEHNIKIKIKIGRNEFGGLEDYEDVIALLLRPGDLLIMPPNFHAAYTSSDCLALGGNFIYASHLDDSLEIAQLLHKHPKFTNDEVHKQEDNEMYRNLVLVNSRFTEVSNPPGWHKDNSPSNRIERLDEISSFSQGKIPRGTGSGRRSGRESNQEGPEPV
jgi:hypothetical protein